MKKTFLSLFLIGMLYVSGTGTGYAIFCTNCATNVQQFKDSVVQKFQLGKETISAAQGTITAAQQTLETVNNRILIPMRDALTIISILKSGDNIKNLVLGATGLDPLLIRNPEQYFKNKTLGPIQSWIGDVAAQKSIYSESIYKNLLLNTRYSYSDTATKVKGFTRSSLPATIQARVCTEDYLTKIATEDVIAGGRPFDAVEFEARKAYFYSRFCVGDPDSSTEEGVETAQALMELQKARPNAGGMDAWLAITGGDNEYTRNMNVQLAVNEGAAEVEARTIKDFDLGGGIKSLTTCVKYAENDINGNLYGESASPPCLVEEIQQTGKMFNTLLEDALKSPAETLRSTLGPGAGSLISTAFTSINLLQSISTAAGNITGGSGGGGGTSQTNTDVINRAPTNDLSGNTRAKTTLTGPPVQQLGFHKKALSDLETIDQNYLNEITFYQNQLDNMKMCYEKLVKDHPQIQSDGRVTAAFSFHSTATTTNARLRATIGEELSLIATTTALVTTTLSAIQASNSSEVILNLFNDYQNRVDTEGLPSQTSGGIREGEYTSFKGNVDQSLSEGGAVFIFKADCAAIRGQLETQDFSGAGA